jgi:hypothetical protein
VLMIPDVITLLLADFRVNPAADVRQEPRHSQGNDGATPTICRDAEFLGKRREVLIRVLESQIRWQ